MHEPSHVARARSSGVMVGTNHSPFGSLRQHIYREAAAYEAMLCSLAVSMGSCLGEAQVGNESSATSIGETSNTIEQHPRGSAIILVVIEDALPHLWLALPAPSVKPLHGCCAGRMCIPPHEAKIFGERLDR